MRRTATLFLALAVLVTAGVTEAAANPIRGAVSATGSTPDPFGRSPSHTIDQSGLSAPYVSGVTDFDTYVPSTQASFVDGTQLGAVGGVAGQYFQYDLGSQFSIDKIAIWAQFGSGSLDHFHLEASNVANFASSIALGNFVMSVFGGANPINADVFSFGAVSARYFRIDVDSNAGFLQSTILNEVAFRQAAPVPEPASLLLLGTGLLATARLRKRAR